MDRELRLLDSVTTPFTDLTVSMQGLVNLSWKSLFSDITFTEKQLAFDLRASKRARLRVGLVNNVFNLRVPTGNTPSCPVSADVA